MNQAFPEIVCFVGGIHGVGKSFLCDQAAGRLGLEHRSASDLIRSQKALPKSKEVEDVSGNQDILVRAVRALPLGTRLLLDGHFCLLNRDGDVVPVPERTFRELMPHALIVVTAPSSIVESRLSTRDGATWSSDRIDRLQLEEKAQAIRIAASLSIPFAVVENDSADAPTRFVDAARKLLG